MLKRIIQKKILNEKSQLKLLIFAVLLIGGGLVNTCYGQTVTLATYRVITSAPPISGAATECTVQVGNKVIDFEISDNVPKSSIKELALIYLKDGRRQTFTEGEIRRCGGLGIIKWRVFPDQMPADLKVEEVILRAEIESSDQKKIIPSRVFVTTLDKPVLSEAIVRQEADGRDDAELYVAGELIAANDQKPDISADIKYERVYGVKAQPLRVGPYFELKLANSKDSSDLLKLGVKIIGTNFTINKGSETFRWESVTGLESDRKFRVTNFLTTQKVKWLIAPKLFTDKDKVVKGNAIFTPFIGLDLGANLKTPIARDGRILARPMAGATLVIKIFEPFKTFPQIFKDFGVQKITWENTYEQRWFLTKEQAYDTDDDDKLILRDFGKKPRGYFMSSLQFKLNKFFAPTISYEWGEQPPLYKKVDHRLKIGFVYSFKRGLDE